MAGENAVPLFERRRGGRRPPCLTVDSPRRAKVSSPVDAETLAAADQPVISEDIDCKFLEVERIAEGGIGVVYKAFRKDSGEEVALKVVRTRDQEVVAIGRSEYELLQRVQHPNIVRALDFIVAGNRTILVMNFFHGHELGTAMSQSETKRLSESIARKLFRLLLEALDHLHSRRIVHRDVKPENVMVTSDWNDLQLIDFNIARYLPEGGALSPRCTPAYAPPEVIDGGSPSEAADIWGAGLCLLTMLTSVCSVFEGKVDYSEFQASDGCEAVLRACLLTDYSMRPAAMTLLSTAWISERLRAFPMRKATV